MVEEVIKQTKRPHDWQGFANQKMCRRVNCYAEWWPMSGKPEPSKPCDGIDPEKYRSNGPQYFSAKD